MEKPDIFDPGIVRSDIRPSLGTGNTAEGIPCTIELTLVNTKLLYYVPHNFSRR